MFNKKGYTYKMKDTPKQAVHESNAESFKDKPKHISLHKGDIMVTIKPREYLCIQKKSLDYLGMKTLIEKSDTYITH